MKVLCVIALLALLSGGLCEGPMPLGDAIRALMAEFKLLYDPMIAIWNENALMDTESCEVAHSLLAAYPPAWAIISSHPDYKELKANFSRAGILDEWEEFVAMRFKPALGLLPSMNDHECSGMRGGTNQLVSEIRAIYEERRPKIRMEIFRLLSASPELNDLLERIMEARETIYALGCIPEVRKVAQIYRSAGINVDKIKEGFFNVFGWNFNFECEVASATEPLEMPEDSTNISNN